MGIRRHTGYWISFCIAILWLWSFWGCHKESIRLNEMTPEEQFAYAKSLFDREDYTKAKTQFLVIVLNNPGSRIVEEAQFYLAESYYNTKEYILAIEEYEKLIRSLPQSPFVDDARYKIGMCYYRLSPGYALDQEYTYKAITQFQRFLEDYPNSDLKPEVEDRLTECREKLAKKEFKTGELYRKMGYYRAALLSFDAVLEKYYDTDFAEDALYWKGECHRRLEEWEVAEGVFQDFLSKHIQSDRVEKVRERLKEIREKQAVSSQELSEGSNPP